jgi:serine O-acetyltransferase
LLPLREEQPLAFSKQIIMADDDPYFVQIRREAEDVLLTEPELGPLLYSTVLSGGVRSFEDAVAATVCYRLLLQDKICGEQYQHGQLRQQEIEGGDDDDDFGGAGSSSSPPSKGGGRQQQRRRQSSLLFTPNSCQSLIRRAFDSDLLELGHTMGEAVRDDVAAVVERDPAMDTYLEVVLFSKGFAALVCHRAAHRLWVPPHRQQEQLQHSSQPMPNKKFTALYLQSQASALFGVDLHPLARFGSGILLDHGTGIVVGETAAVGDGCTILHGVTLGGTGKDHGDRHPKVGKHVLIGAGSSILGNIQVGDSAKIGAGSVVLRSIPPFATAVGAPAKVSALGVLVAFFVRAKVSQRQPLNAVSRFLCADHWTDRRGRSGPRRRSRPAARGEPEGPVVERVDGAPHLVGRGGRFRRGRAR